MISEVWPSPVVLPRRVLARMFPPLLVTSVSPIGLSIVPLRRTFAFDCPWMVTSVGNAFWMIAKPAGEAKLTVGAFSVTFG